MRGTPGGRVVAFVAWSTMTAGAGFVVGLVTEADDWFWTLSYNPMTASLIAIAVTVVIWWIDRSGRAR